MTIKPASPSSNPPTLSFPPLTYAKLSPSPFLLAHLQPADLATPSVRPNGRRPTAFRPPTAHSGSLTHTSGSAVVRVGDTAVVCGVRAEILLAKDVPGYRVNGGETPARSTDMTTERERRRKGKDEIAELGLLVPNLELATGCSPLFLPGSPLSTLAQSLSQRILTLLSSSGVIEAEELKIWYQAPPMSTSTSVAGGTKDDYEEEAPEPEIIAFWTLYIDVLFISLDGNPFDAAWAAVMLALKDTRLPRAWWDADRQMVLCDDLVANSKTLKMETWPVAATFGVFEAEGTEQAVGKGKESGKKAWILADPDAFEESLCQEEVTVVVDVQEEGTKVLRLEKSGGGSVGVKEMKELVDIAETRWKEWIAVEKS